MASKGAKKSQSSTRTGSASKNEAASVAASIAGSRKYIIWPEWSDADVNGEKWDAHKSKEKAKSPVVQHFFEDPDGKLEMPPSLKVDHWKRPTEFIGEKTPVVVDNDGMASFDLMTANEHIHGSELIRWVTSQVVALWNVSTVKNPNPDMPVDPAAGECGEFLHTWRPWEHIYALNKVTKGPNVPPYNPHGKYVVKLYWMGCWRKVVVDDLLPFDDNEKMLLPASTLQHELWPMLLTKALIKIASIDYNGGSSACEFGDFNVINCLTGWLPEIIPLQNGHINEIWELLKGTVTEWKLPDPEAEKAAEEAKEELAAQEALKEEKLEKELKEAKTEKTESKTGKDKKDGKGKDDKKDKKDKDGKDKHKAEKNMVQEEVPLPEHPELVVFASYSGPPKFPVRVSVLADMASASERLRQTGISPMFPHPVLVTKTRSCPLEPPPVPEVIPAWKLIRPRKKKTTPSDEPVEEPEPPKPIQCVEISSPFINYKVSPVPIPTDTHRPKSALERGGTRPPTRTASVAAIEETDENAPEPEPEPVKEEPKPKTPEPEEPKPEPVEEVSPKGKARPGSSKKKRLKSSDSRDKKNADTRESPQPASRSPDRRRSAASRERLDSKSSTDSKQRDARSEVLKSKGTDGQSQASSDVIAASADPEGEKSATEEEAPPGDEEPELITKPAQDIWMDYDVFSKCFRTLVVYHKSATYPCNQKHSDMKSIVTSSRDGKKSAPPTASGSDDKTPNYLFVDSLKNTEIVISFSTLSRWNEPPFIKEDKSHSTLKGGGKDRDRDTRLDVIDSLSVLGGSEALPPGDAAVEPPPQPGLLVAEPYSWKSLVTGQPIVRLRSTATKAAVLSLPAGRHLIRFHMTAPLGYHVHLCSSTQFVFGDEDKVMAELTKESCRFVDNATQVMLSLGKCITAFNDEGGLQQAYEEFTDCHCPYRKQRRFSKIHHHKLFLDGFYGMLKKALGEASLISAEMQQAWRALLFDCITPNPLGIPVTGETTSRPATALNSHRGSARHEKKKQSAQIDTTGDQPEPKLEYWLNREITPEEHAAAGKIQKSWRGYSVQKITRARTPGTEENMKVKETLQKAWSVLEPHAEAHGLYLFRSMFKADPDLMSLYPFHKDEWNKISYSDYQGNFADQAASSWFVVFREVFYVTEEMLCVPKLYVPIPTCMLRVVNNDTMEEIPRVFQKVAPHVYKPNKKGYTFMAEARTTDHPLQPGRWKMRLIGSLSPLPAPVKNEVNSSFHTRELRDYYIPNEKNIILRYSVRVLDDHVVTLQMSTSKPDVYINLQVLDAGQELVSATGKGHVVLPSFLFVKDGGSDEDSKRSSSRSSTKVPKGNEKGGKDGGKSKRTTSPGGGRVSRTSSRKSITSVPDEEDVETKPHKYIIQATVLRNSWPLSESSWNFVQMLKESEKNDLKVANKERPPSAARTEKVPSQSSKATKGKGKDKASKDKGSRPPSQQFDFSKPNWLLRIVSDGAAAEEIDIKKDTERADEIRAIKRAWEEAEPGRAAKAMTSRQKYLEGHMVKVKDDTADVSPTEVPSDATAPTMPSDTRVTSPLEAETESVLHLAPPRPQTPKEILEPLDISPFIRKRSDNVRLLDEAEAQAQLEIRQQEIREYRAHREEVERRRELDFQQRNMAKIKQLEMCQQMQNALDAAREAVNKPRTAFRQKFLEAEQKRLDEIAAAEAAMRAEAEKNAPTPKGRKSAKGKKSPAGKKKK